MHDLPVIDDHTALLLIDPQTGFKNAFTQHLFPQCEEIQASYKHVIITQFFNDQGSPYERWLNWNRFAKGSEDTALAITPANHASVFSKNSYSSLTDEVIDYLNDHDIRTVHLAGFDTNACILATMFAFFEYKKIRPIVLSELCGSHSGEEIHDDAIKMIEKICGKKQIWIGQEI